MKGDPLDGTYYSTRQLRAAMASGRRKVVLRWQTGPGGKPLTATYAPRSKGDKWPWVVGQLRYQACQLTLA